MTNALPFDWQAESATYANPPWSLIHQVLSKNVADEVRIMLVVPEWPRAPWFKLFRRLVERHSVWTAHSNLQTTVSYGQRRVGLRLLP